MEREILLITGVRSDDPIYMAAGLERLARFPNVDVIVTIGRPAGRIGAGEGGVSKRARSILESRRYRLCLRSGLK